MTYARVFRDDDDENPVFTTGKIARICKVAPRTVSKWIDSGRLAGYRIPGSEDRRVPRDNLIRFLKEHGMPLGNLEDRRVLVCGLAERDAAAIGVLAATAGQAAEVCDSPFQVGVRLGGAAFSGAVVLAAHVGREAIGRIAATVCGDPKYSDVRLVVVADHDAEEGLADELVRLSVDQVVVPPVDWCSVLGFPRRAA
jgi:two-component system, OmpR family, response regulator RpaA